MPPKKKSGSNRRSKYDQLKTRLATARKQHKEAIIGEAPPANTKQRMVPRAPRDVTASVINEEENRDLFERILVDRHGDYRAVLEDAIRQSERNPARKQVLTKILDQLLPCYPNKRRFHVAVPDTSPTTVHQMRRLGASLGVPDARNLDPTELQQRISIYQDREERGKDLLRRFAEFYTSAQSDQTLRDAYATFIKNPTVETVIAHRYLEQSKDENPGPKATPETQRAMRDLFGTSSDDESGSSDGESRTRPASAQESRERKVRELFGSEEIDDSDVSDGDSNVSDGDSNVSDGDSNVSDGDSNVSDGDSNVSDGDREDPDTVVDGPATPVSPSEVVEDRPARPIRFYDQITDCVSTVRPKTTAFYEADAVPRACVERYTNPPWINDLVRAVYIRFIQPESFNESEFVAGQYP